MLAIALLLPGLGAAPFDDPGEGQQAEIAREISTGGHWLTLRLNGVRYFDKPPLLYWLAAGSFALFDPGEWSARLVPLLGAVLAAAGTALLGARLLGLGGGLVGAGALLSSALFVAFSRYVRPETLFVAAIQWGFTGLLLGAGSTAGNPRSRRWLLLGCLGLGIASIAKDPLGLVGPLAAVGLALALAGRARPLSTWLPWEGAAVLLVVGFGWYAIAAAREPGFLWYSVVDNHLLNAARLRRFPDEDVPLSALEFIAVSGAGCFPWIIAAGAAVASMARRRAWRDPSEAPWIALALWAVGLVAFFILVPFRLPHYALPIYPAVALLAARGWWSASSRARPLIAAHACAFVVLGAGFALAAASDGARFIDVVFSATDVYTRKQAVLGESGPTLPWSSLQPLVARGAVTFAVTGAALILALV
ncbi:MAG TPA: glycosyltransferase family 39 protein, partial [Candidatus Methylomirabilis sp.]|nr:glycosyltransferase family 39 protein [Candidatus Methylomirabilis sp.]